MAYLSLVLTYTHSLSIRNTLIRNDPLNSSIIRNHDPLNFSIIRNDEMNYQHEKCQKTDGLIKSNSYETIAMFE